MEDLRRNSRLNQRKWEIYLIMNWIMISQDGTLTGTFGSYGYSNVFVLRRVDHHRKWSLWRAVHNLNMRQQPKETFLLWKLKGKVLRTWRKVFDLKQTKGARVPQVARRRTKKGQVAFSNWVVRRRDTKDEHLLSLLSIDDES